MRAQAQRAGHQLGRVVNKLLRRRAPELREAAVERRVLSPAEREEVEPPRMPEGHLERILSGWEREPAHFVVDRLTRREVQHDASEALTLRDAVLIGPELYAGAFRANLFRGERPGLHDVPEFDEVILSTTRAGARWFGHFVHDELPLQLLAHELGHAVAHARPLFRDEPSLRRLFGVAQPTVLKGFRARRCTLLVDHAQNASKRARYRRMQANVPREPGPSTRVYLQRTGGERRELQGEEALLERLLREGFTILRAGEEPVERVVAACSRAEQIVSVDGSHLAPALFSAPRGTELVTVSPPARVSTVPPDVARASGLRAAVFIGSPAASLEEPSFTGDADELLRFLDEDARK